jgi:hypothetical protein
MTEGHRRLSQNGRLMMKVVAALRDYDISEVQVMAERFREKLAAERLALPARRGPTSMAVPAKRKRTKTTVKSRAAMLAKTRSPAVKKQTAKKAKGQKPPPAPPVVTAAKPRKRSKTTRIRRPTVVA